MMVVSLEHDHALHSVACMVLEIGAPISLGPEKLHRHGDSSQALASYS